MKRLLRPNVLIPLIFGAALVAALLSFANVTKVIALITAFHPVGVLYFVLLMLAYEAVRGVQWHVLLRALGVEASLRTQAFTFLGGEVTKSLPIGNYFQNYLLQQSEGTDFSRSSAATTLVIWVEDAVCLVGLLILGLGHWTWLRPVIALGLAAAALVGGALYAGRDAVHAPRWMERRKSMRALIAGIKTFREGASDLLRPRLLILVTALGAVYLTIAGAALYVVAHGLGLGAVTVTQVLAVYFFSLAIGLLIPIPVDIGLTEVSGVGAFLAIDANKNAAVGVMLLNRVLSIVAALLIALVAAVFLRAEFRAVLRARPRRSPPTRAAARAARA